MTKLSTNLLLLFIGVALCLILTGCADAHNVARCVTGHTYGFWGGLWHGIIAPVTFIISLFDEKIAVWATNNNGNWYNFGFLLGVGAFTHGSSRASRFRRKVRESVD